MTAVVDHPTFAHEAFFYSDQAEYLGTLVPFIRQGVETGDAVLVAVDPESTASLRRELGGHAESVEFVEMRTVGVNPGRIIPVWIDFVRVNTAAGRNVRGIGEPAWAGRSDAALSECHQHEALLNVAFSEGPAWPLICPYDAAALSSDALAEAHRTHPLVRDAGGLRRSPQFSVTAASSLDGPPLLPAPADAIVIDFDTSSLRSLRNLVSAFGAAAGLPTNRVEQLVLAVSESATNSILHGSGPATLRMWDEPDHVICEVTDSGRITDPLAGRHSPRVDQEQGRGLWLINSLCDLVQLRTRLGATVVRMHVAKHVV